MGSTTFLLKEQDQYFSYKRRSNFGRASSFKESGERDKMRPLQSNIIFQHSRSNFQHYLSGHLLAHLSLFRVSFWDTAMSVVRRTCGRP